MNRDLDIETMSRVQLKDELQRLRNVIHDVHSQYGDDLCWLDIDRIFLAVGLPVPNRTVGDKAAMLKNCARFIGTMCSGGQWRSYAELERDIEQLKAQHEDLVFRNRILRERPDLPVDRIPAHNALVKLQEFRQLTHALLDEMGVPGCKHAADCRLRARLAWIGTVLRPARDMVAMLKQVGDQTNWADGDETDRVFAWHEIEPLANALEAFGDEPRNDQPVSDL